MITKTKRHNGATINQCYGLLCDLFKLNRDYWFSYSYLRRYLQVYNCVLTNSLRRLLAERYIICDNGYYRKRFTTYAIDNKAEKEKTAVRL